LERRIPEALVLRAKVRDLSFRSVHLARQMLLARRIAIQTPRGLPAALADPRIRIDAGRKAKLPATLLIGIGPSHGQKAPDDRRSCDVAMKAQSKKPARGLARGPDRQNCPALRLDKVAARLNYFRELLMAVYWLLRLVPMPLTTAMMANAMPAAIRP